MGGADFVLMLPDRQAVQHVSVGRVAELWIYPAAGDAWSARMLGAYVIMNVTQQPGGGSIAVQGSDLLQDFKDDITLPNTVYDDATVQSVLNGVVTGLSGWSFSGTGLTGIKFSGRFQGVSKLKLLQDVVEKHGVHFRLASNASKTVQAGAFGAVSGIVMAYYEGGADVRMDADLPMVIEQVELIEESFDVINWVLPFGAGDGDAALSLADSTRAGISSATNNGRTYNYIDKTGTSTYPRTVKARWNNKSIVQIDESSTARENAANLLFDWADAKLDKYLDPYSSYMVTVRNVTEAIDIGAKVRLHVVGSIVRRDYDEGGGYFRYQWANVNADFFVMRVTERWGADGLVATVTLASVDRQPETVEDTIVGLDDSITVAQEHVQPNVNSYKDQLGARVCTTSQDGEFDLKIYAGFYKARRIILELTRYPIVTHQHEWVRHIDENGNTPQTVPPSLMTFEGKDIASGAVTARNAVIFSDLAIGEAGLTSPSSDVYGSPLTVKPETVVVKVGASTVDSDAFSDGGTPADSASIDITSQITTSGDYTITCELGDGYGWIQANVYIEYEQSATWSN